MTPESDRLDGWKEIAVYLKKSVRTVQTWADENGLPVRKLGGRAVAYKSELDSWVRNASRSEPEVVEVPVGSRRARPAWIIPAWIVGSGLVIASLGAAAAWYASRPGPPVEYRVEGMVLRTFDSRGKTVWEARLPEKPLANEYAVGNATHRKSGLFADLNGDGRVELLFALAPEPNRSWVLLCFDSNGSIVWRAPLGRRVETVDGATILPLYRLNSLGVLRHPRADGGRIVVGIHHSYSWAYQVSVLTGSGKQVAEYWHPGWFFQIDVADIDGDGHDEIICGGVNNGFRDLGHGATVVVLDSERVSGQGTSPEGDTFHQIRGLPTGQEAAVLLFPDPFASEANRENFPRVDLLSFVTGYLNVRIARPEVPQYHVHYQLDRHLRIASITPSAEAEHFAGLGAAEGVERAQREFARIQFIRNRFAPVGAR